MGFPIDFREEVGEDFGGFPGPGKLGLDWGVHVVYTDAIDTLFKHKFRENLYYKAEVVDLAKKD